jgi:predicted lipid-binding transport protein (Tim44 family)
MKKRISLLATLMIAFALFFAAVNEAQAKRLGGGKSFGSKPSYSQPFQRTAPPSSADAQPSRSNSVTPANNPSPTAATPSRSSGLSRGLMGMLGGLAIGGLLGSLLSGSAFNGFGLLDGLILVLIVYGLYRLFAKSRQSEPTPAYLRNTTDNDSFSNNYAQSPRHSSSGFDTDLLFSKNKSAPQSHSLPATTPLKQPAGFDAESFLAIAEKNYCALQMAWDDHDLAELRGLTTDKVFAELQQQLKETFDDERTDILKINAELLEVREINSKLEAVVLFNNILRENRHEQAEQVREIWHFVKSDNRLKPNWLLDGIQQLEE